MSERLERQDALPPRSGMWQKPLRSTLVDEAEQTPHPQRKVGGGARN
jgi:hypothetical protein